MELIYLDGEQKGQRFQLTPPGISIGRESDNDLQLLVNGVSRYHAMISFDGKDWYIEDLGSTNGVFLCDQKISAKEKLSPGDTIGIGNQSFGFSGEESNNIPSATDVTAIIENNTAQEFSAQEHPEEQDLASEIRRSKFSIFSGSQKNSNKGPKNTKRGKLWNLIYTLLIVTLPLVCISGYMLWVKNKEAKNKQETVKPKEHPFFFYYEKIETASDNVFRFEARIENDVIKFTIDDLKYGRHAVKEKKVDKASIERLKADLKKISSDFAKLSNSDTNAPDGPVEVYRRIDLAVDGKFNSVVARSSTTSFEKAEEAFKDFASLDNDLRVGLMTAQEMLEEAKEFFTLAENHFANYQASPKNIRLAIEKYQAAFNDYDFFEPKPKEWDICRKQLEKAQAIYKKMHKELYSNMQQHNKMGNPEEASRVCSKLMELLDPKSDDYQKIRNFKIEFDRMSKAQKTKKRK